MNFADLDNGEYKVKVSDTELIIIYERFEGIDPIRIVSVNGDEIWISKDGDDIIVGYEKKCKGKLICIEPIK